MGTPGAAPALTAAAVAPSPPLSNVFVYGSLLADEVVSVLLKRVPASSPAVLHHYHRYSIKGRVYPAILPVENKTVTGKVLLGITDREMDTLDIFEDEEYDRTPVAVSMIDSTEKLNAYAYVWGNKDDPDLYGDWDFDEWKQLKMKDFIEMATSFMEELEEPDPKSRVATYESYFQE